MNFLEHGHFGSEIIVADMRVSIAAPVLTMDDHGLRFNVGKGARRRFPKHTHIDLIVLHWTGGEGTARQTFKTLTSRKLGVEFVIDRQGVVFQFADPALVDTFDAGRVNPRSVGIEITNYGIRHPGHKIPHKGEDRPVYQTQLNGKPRSFASFYPTQLRSAIALCDGLCSVLHHVERKIPRNGGGRLMRRVMSKAELEAYSGVLGHYHVSRRKSDPGTSIFQAFEHAGY